ncbi:MAG: SdpI family protein [Hyphomonas sp.]|nr:SdpI family protein [Hyphomonas sp.]
MKTHIRIGLAWSAFVVAAMIAMILYAGAHIPDAAEVGTHFGPDGGADQFGDRGRALGLLWILPGVATCMALILAVAPLVDPRKRNIEVGRQAYLVTWLGVMTLQGVVMAGIVVSMIRSVEGAYEGPEIVRMIIAGMALLFIVMGNYMPKTRSSYIFGLRTPWTLSSDIAWEKTHRLAGRLFIIAGLLGLAGALLFNGIWLALQLPACVMAAVFASAIYSYFAWRTAPDREHGTNLTV